MADTRLILHVKGTQAETKELPKEDVKTAVAEGKLSYSQLIWSAPDQAWKQVRELPDLLPGESLILHVKGTESQTRELPKNAVKNAISRGEITHSQLIWSPTDSAWKQVRELPDLLPGETMILHVKGTDSQTRELPKPAIRAAISKGEITHSQLIWSPLDSAWKPVSEMPDLLPGESLILHVKGSTADTKEMPKTAIRTAIKEGKITHSQLIWSAPEHQWKQVRDLPELLPSQKLAPAPGRQAQIPVIDNSVGVSAQAPVARPAAAASTATTPKARPAVVGPPRVTPTGASASAVPQPKVAQPSLAGGATPAVKAGQAAVPSAQVRAAVAAGPKAASGPKPTVAAALPYQSPSIGGDHTVKAEHDDFHPVKWLCIVLGALVFIVVAANYFMVDRPLNTNFAQTPSPYANVLVYAHYGGFVQPNVMVIHIPASDKITPDNITDFLVTLAHSTPQNPITGDYFERVALTSGWTAQYSFAGSAWKQLGDMQQDSADDRKARILEDGSDASGQPLLGESTLNQAAQEARRDEAWKSFVAKFTKPGS
jgi:hypothetical protein